MARSDPQDRHSQRELTGFAGFLGARVAALRWADLPPEAIQWAKVGILDTVGVTLAGSREEAPRLLAAALDLARTTCRRAERRVAALVSDDKNFNIEILRYLNRLSDLCWLLARKIEQTNRSGSG